MLQTAAVHLSANALLFPRLLCMSLVTQVSLNEWRRQVPIRDPVNRRVELARDLT